LKNKERSLKNKKLLVDTSFLLPALGIKVEENVMRTIEFFHQYEICYMEVSILEAMWSILKLIPHDKLNIIERGIEAIRESYELVNPPPKAFIKAYEIYLNGHRDYIDNLIYATSIIQGLSLLTIDQQLINFLKRKNYPTENIITPEGLIK